MQNKYLIKCKLDTVAKLNTPFEEAGYSFSSFEKEFWKSKSWVASKELNAEHAGEARYEFLMELFPLVERLSVISQCQFQARITTQLIYRLNNNNNKKAWVRYVRDRNPVGLPFDKNEIEQLKKLEALDNNVATFFIAEAAGSTTFHSRFAMLLCAVEALAGEIKTDYGFQTNKENLKSILGETLYENFYITFNGGVGLRNQIFHGKLKDVYALGNYVEELYKLIMLYLKKKYDVQLEENVVNPQRGFYGNLEEAKVFVRYKTEPVFDLKTVEDYMKDTHPNNDFLEICTPDEGKY